jgi:integration host factor subunit alpha
MPSQKAVTRADIIQAICAADSGVSRTQARAIFATMLEEFSAALVQGENVKLHAFGLFAIRSKRERIGRNPRTGVEVAITQRRVVTFKPSSILTTQVNVNFPQKIV